MFELEHVTRVAAAPLRVWLALVDFPGHARWKPIALTGAPEPDGAIEYRFRMVAMNRTMSSSGRIVRFDKPAAFAWQTGLGGVFQFQEAFEIAPDAGGSRVRHAFRVGGVLGRILAPVVRRGLMRTLEESDRRMERYLRSVSAAAVPGRRPPSARPRGKKTRQ